MSINFWSRKVQAYRDLFKTEKGQIILADLLKVCKINSMSYVEGSPDKTAFNEGAKFVAHYIKGILNYSEEDINKILEASKASNNNNFTNPLRKNNE